MNKGIQDIIETGWETPPNPFFNVITTPEKQVTTNKSSYYGHLFPSQDFSIEVSNQYMLASLDEKGLVKNLNFFRDSYYTEDKPGTWVSNGFVQEKNIGIEVQIAGKKSVLAKQDHRIEYDLLFNLIPRFVHYYSGVKILQLFLPIYLESGKAISGLLQICDISKNSSDAKLIFPRCYNAKYSDRHNVEFNYSYNERNLKSGSGWVTLTDPNAVFNVSQAEMNNIIISSYQHVVQKYGQLNIPDNPKLAALIIRKSDSALNSISRSTNGTVVGANWGSSPVVNRTWLRDMYYASLPAIYFDHDLAKQVILWFSKYEIKPKGDKFKGGVQHSVENSLNSTILLALYLEQTNDIAFIQNNLQLWEHVLYVVNYLIVHRDKTYGLVKSQWVSDGIALGDFHTGTQITFWTAISGVARIYRQVLNEPENAIFYEKTADEIKEKIEQYVLIKDKQGNKKYDEGVNPDTKKTTVDAHQYEQGLSKQGLDFLTRVNQNHQITLKFHDGEESDTTLAPFYGFNDVLESHYLNTLKFAASNNNPSYSSLSKGISWGNQAEATFPGYITTFMGTVDREDKFKQRIDLLFKLADLDGSWWWWPYEVGNSGKDVMRFNHCGKCGWSDGTFSVLMIKNVMGIDFDSQKNILNIKPLEVVPNFNWCDFPLTNGMRADIKYQKAKENSSITIRIRGSEPKKILVKFQPQGCRVAKKEFLNTKIRVQINSEARQNV